MLQGPPLSLLTLFFRIELWRLFLMVFCSIWYQCRSNTRVSVLAWFMWGLPPPPPPHNLLTPPILVCHPLASQMNLCPYLTEIFQVTFPHRELFRSQLGVHLLKVPQNENKPWPITYCASEMCILNISYI